MLASQGPPSDCKSSSAEKNASHKQAILGSYAESETGKRLWSLKLRVALPINASLAVVIFKQREMRMPWPVAGGLLVSVCHTQFLFINVLIILSRKIKNFIY